VCVVPKGCVYAETLSSKLAKTKSESGVEERFEEADLWATAPNAIAEAANRTAGRRSYRAADFGGNGSSEQRSRGGRRL
jgi:hypothetical protein